MRLTGMCKAPGILASPARVVAAALAGLMVLVGASPVWAQSEAAKAETPKAETEAAKPESGKAEAPKIALELNKLEPTDKGCRVYMLTTNGSAISYPAYQLDLVLFQPDGVIAKRIGMDIGPIKPSKRSLKLFDLDGLPCDRIGSMLVNDVLDCKSDAGAVSQGACLAGLTLTSLGSVKIAK